MTVLSKINLEIEVYLLNINGVNFLNIRLRKNRRIKERFPLLCSVEKKLNFERFNQYCKFEKLSIFYDLVKEDLGKTLEKKANKFNCVWKIRLAAIWFLTNNPKLCKEAILLLSVLP
jgi:hypothetical protein